MTINQLTLDHLGSTIINHRFKGIPLGTSITLADIGTRGWNVARGDLALPVTTLRHRALTHNLATMSEYCRRNDVLLAPHGKTTMSPQLFDLQLQAGAWAITAATMTQVAVMREFGVGRILLANQITESAPLKWIARELQEDDSFHFMCLVDTVETVQFMDEVLASVFVDRTLSVLLEVGAVGGRCGVRSSDEAEAVAQSVRASRHLVLAGIEFYEGVITQGVSQTQMGEIDALGHQVQLVIERLAGAELFDVSPITVSAGGSAYFDRVIRLFKAWDQNSVSMQLLLRSGCYLTHDEGRYRDVSPLGARRVLDEPLYLDNALEGWASVLSRPEPDLAILGTGKRDLPYDLGLPTPLRAYPQNGSPPISLRDRATVFSLMDQHAFVRIPADLALCAGDVVALGVSHPCTAFDKMRLIPIIDDDNVVVDGALTFF